jgi:hypothetical protein
MAMAVVGVDGQRCQWRATVMHNREGIWVGEDIGESSEIFDYSVEPGGTIS